MTGRIPWTRYSGEDVESVLATFISLEERDAIKVRPSRGDGGIDLIVYLDAETVDVYQIKKFAENLKSSQKAQIENSWKELSATTADLRVKINSWHLVMPLEQNSSGMGFQELMAGRPSTQKWSIITFRMEKKRSLSMLRNCSPWPIFQTAAIQPFSKTDYVIFAPI